MELRPEDAAGTAEKLTFFDFVLGLARLPSACGGDMALCVNLLGDRARGSGESKLETGME